MPYVHSVVERRAKMTRWRCFRTLVPTLTGSNCKFLKLTVNAPIFGGNVTPRAFSDERWPKIGRLLAFSKIRITAVQLRASLFQIWSTFLRSSNNPAAPAAR